MEIRRLHKNESDLVTELFNNYRIFYKQPSDTILAKTFIKARLENNESVIFVAFKDNNPIGFTQLYPKYSSMRATKNWLLNDLYVHPDHRKKGIGKSLIEAVFLFTKGDDAKFVEISTAIDNFAAQSLYEGLGFIKQLPDNQFYNYKIEL
jgi:ribosomal protein S18 acetylase RimI-like enzyme